MSMDDPGAVLRQRIRDQSSFHWSEFGSIVAGGNIAAGIGSVGLLISRRQPQATQLLMALMLVASILTVILAYFAIQVAAQVVLSPLNLAHIVTSFTIAASQGGMFLLIAGTAAGGTTSTVARQLVNLRAWPALYAVYALSAALANVIGARDRRAWQTKLSGSDLDIITKFNSLQVNDAKGAAIGGVTSFLAWVGLLIWPSLLLAYSIVIVSIVLMAVALVSQHKTELVLWRLI